jgi:hypothetical protein
MKLACLLSLGDGIISCQRKGDPFRPTERGRLPFLVSVKPVSLVPVCPALDASAAAGQQSQPAGRAARIELGVLRALGGLLVMTVLGCGLGAQHVAYTREKHTLGRQLRQKEIELCAVTQAYRSLESEKALLVAQELPQAAVNFARVDPIQEAAASSAGRLGGGRESKPAPVRASSSVPSSRRSQVADARLPARRGRIRS